MTVLMAVLYVLLAASSGAGCKKERSSTEYIPERITVTKDLLLLEVGEAVQISAAAVPAVANQLPFQWKAADETIATVNSGLVTGLREGQTSITVSYKDISTVIPVKVTASEKNKTLAVLFDKHLTNVQPPELLLNDVGRHSPGGLIITGTGNTVKLDKFYAVAERKVEYRIRLSADAKAVFHSSERDFNAYIDIPNKKITIATHPVTEKTVGFLQEDRDYIVEVYHIYQEAKLRITDAQTGQTAEITAVNDGQGGAGKGVLQPGFGVGMQWDYYCFGLAGGTSMLVKRITVYALKKKVKLLMYGDSITQPEGYFPTKDFPLAWTQQVIGRLKGNAMSSGRGGAQIDMVMNYIKNELPYIDAEYVMITIGTNGGNTEAKLKQLVNYIKSRGAIPLLNNIPANESGTQVSENNLIAKVRNDLNIKGCRFDLPTSLAGDGKAVDQSTMYWEDYSGSYGWQIYHHPNESGGDKMFQQTLIDLPDLYR